MTAGEPVPAPPPEAAPDVTLVCMPYAALSRPSMALGLLTALLDQDGISSTTAYANLWFAEYVGLSRYQLCAGRVPTDLLVGEWTFRAAAFGPDEQRDTEFVDYVIATGGKWLPSTPTGLARFRRTLFAARDAAVSFVDVAARRILAAGPRIVGCTSTFEQHVPSLALLRRIRELDPDVVTMLGGANCETAMGEATHRRFEFVDFVVSGEADGVVAPLVRAVLDRGRDLPLPDLPRGVRGPAHRRTLPLAGRPTTLARALFRDLDALPTPDFDGYFHALDDSALQPFIRPGLPLETSRGCWWGAKHQCTFCGLNGSSMTYSSKSAPKVLAELHHLEQRHGVRDFEVVDNILDTHYFTSLLPALSAEAADRRIFFEVKANLQRAQVEQLVAAGVTWVQPGIESLDSDVLALMDKGVQAWQNIQLMKWARELGLRMSWSILWGFPGEDDAAYARMADRAPLLQHLQPPANVVRLRYDRFSVYHNEAVERGIELHPVPAMGRIYPVPAAELQDLTYFFVADGAGRDQRHAGAATDVAARTGVRRLMDEVLAWQLAFRDAPAELRMTDAGDHLSIVDTRACATAPRHELRGADRLVALACASGVRPDRVAARIGEGGAGIPAEAVEAAVRRLIADRLALLVDDRLLGLALDRPAPELPATADFPGGSVSLEKAEAAVSRPTS
jgi:ribosomal peptide maturation radical SAM protein 1